MKFGFFSSATRTSLASSSHDSAPSAPPAIPVNPGLQAIADRRLATQSQKGKPSRLLRFDKIMEPFYNRKWNEIILKNNINSFLQDTCNHSKAGEDKINRNFEYGYTLLTFFLDQHAPFLENPRLVMDIVTIFEAFEADLNKPTVCSDLRDVYPICYFLKYYDIFKAQQPVEEDTTILSIYLKKSKFKPLAISENKQLILLDFLLNLKDSEGKTPASINLMLKEIFDSCCEEYQLKEHPLFISSHTAKLFYKRMAKIENNMLANEQQWLYFAFSSPLSSTLPDQTGFKTFASSLTDHNDISSFRKVHDFIENNDLKEGLNLALFGESCSAIDKLSNSEKEFVLKNNTLLKTIRNSKLTRHAELRLELFRAAFKALKQIEFETFIAKDKKLLEGTVSPSELLKETKTSQKLYEDCLDYKETASTFLDIVACNKRYENINFTLNSYKEQLDRDPGFFVTLNDEFLAILNECGIKQNDLVRFTVWQESLLEAHQNEKELLQSHQPLAFEFLDAHAPFSDFVTCSKNGWPNKQSYDLACSFEIVDQQQHYSSLFTKNIELLEQLKSANFSIEDAKLILDLGINIYIFSILKREPYASHGLLSLLTESHIQDDSDRINHLTTLLRLTSDVSSLSLLFSSQQAYTIAKRFPGFLAKLMLRNLSLTTIKNATYIAQYKSASTEPDTDIDVELQESLDTFLKDERLMNNFGGQLSYIFNSEILFKIFFQTGSIGLTKTSLNKRLDLKVLNTFLNSDIFVNYINPSSNRDQSLQTILYEHDDNGTLQRLAKLNLSLDPAPHPGLVQKLLHTLPAHITVPFFEKEFRSLPVQKRTFYNDVFNEIEDEYIKDAWPIFTHPQFDEMVLAKDRDFAITFAKRLRSPWSYTENHDQAIRILGDCCKSIQESKTPSLRKIRRNFLLAAVGGAKNYQEISNKLEEMSISMPGSEIEIIETTLQLFEKQDVRAALLLGHVNTSSDVFNEKIQTSDGHSLATLIADRLQKSFHSNDRLAYRYYQDILSAIKPKGILLNQPDKKGNTAVRLLLASRDWESLTRINEAELNLSQYPSTESLTTPFISILKENGVTAALSIQPFVTLLEQLLLPSSKVQYIAIEELLKEFDEGTVMGIFARLGIDKSALILNCIRKKIKKLLVALYKNNPASFDPPNIRAELIKVWFANDSSLYDYVKDNPNLFTELVLTVLEKLPLDQFDPEDRRPLLQFLVATSDSVDQMSYLTANADRFVHSFSTINQLAQSNQQIGRHVPAWKSLLLSSDNRLSLSEISNILANYSAVLDKYQENDKHLKIVFDLINSDLRSSPDTFEQSSESLHTRLSHRILGDGTAEEIVERFKKQPNRLSDKELAEFQRCAEKCVELFDSKYCLEKTAAERKKQIEAWSNEMRQRQSSVTKQEILALVRYAIHLTHGKMPHHTQLITCLHHLENKNHASTVHTGQGKSFIIAMTAACRVLLYKESIDILTSTRQLADRDYTEMSEFFSVLGISSAKKVRHATSSDVQVRYLVMDDLVDQENQRRRELWFNKKIIQNQRTLIVDESDTITSGDLGPGCFYAWVSESFPKKFYETVWNNIDKITTRNILDVLTNNGVNLTESQRYVLNKQSSSLLMGCREVKRGEQDSYQVQGQSIAFYNKNIGTYSTAITYQTRWLEHKHGLSISDIHIKTTPIFYGQVLHSYPKIHLITGTMGGNLIKKDLESQFKVLITETPPLSDTRNVTYEPLVISENKQKHLKAITEYVRKTSKAGRPLLVITQTPEQLNDIWNALTPLKSEPGLDTLYLQKITASDTDVNALKTKINLATEAPNGLGTITLTTTIGSRGFDYRVRMPEINKRKGGYTVLITAYQEDERHTTQSEGRTGRQGDPGVIKYILLKQDIPADKEDPIVEVKDLQKLRQSRLGDALKKLQKNRLESRFEDAITQYFFRACITQNKSNSNDNLKKWAVFINNVEMPENITIQDPNLIANQIGNIRSNGMSEGMLKTKLDIDKLISTLS